MRITVLGGTRFVGRAIVEAALADGHRVQVVHRGVTEPAGAVAAAEHVHVDRARLGEARAALTAFDPDAWVDTGAMTRWDAIRAVEAMPPASHRIVLSSMDVYRAYAAVHTGSVVDAVPLGEDAVVRSQRYPHRGLIEGREDYEKLDVEEVYLDHGARVLRLGFVFGPHDPQHREEPVLRRIRAGRAQLPVATGAFVGSRVLVTDVAAAVLASLATPPASGVLNICEQASPSAALWATWIADCAGAALELAPVAQDLLPEDLRLFGAVPQHLLASPQRALRQLSWRPTDAREATGRSVAWHLANPPAETGDFAADDRALFTGGTSP